MRPQCAVKDCPGSKRWFRFPVHNKLLHEKWLDNLGHPKDYTHKTTVRVCEKHFSKDVTLKMKLLKDSVPTLNLGHNLPILHSNRKERKKRISKRKCCIVGCNTTNRDGKFFSFPETEPRRSYWFKVCNRKPQKSIVICQRHFPEYMFRASRLESFAIPCLHLNNDSAERVSVPNENWTNTQLTTTNESRELIVERYDVNNIQYTVNIDNSEESEMENDDECIGQAPENVDESADSEFEHNDYVYAENNQNIQQRDKFHMNKLNLNTHMESMDIFPLSKAKQSSLQGTENVEVKSKCNCSARESKKLQYYRRQLKIMKGTITKLRMEKRKLKTKVNMLKEFYCISGCTC